MVWARLDQRPVGASVRVGCESSSQSAGVMRRMFGLALPPVAAQEKTEPNSFGGYF